MTPNPSAASHELVGNPKPVLDDKVRVVTLSPGRDRWLVRFIGVGGVGLHRCRSSYVLSPSWQFLGRRVYVRDVLESAILLQP
jgi:hypothetical protein